ncbi:MAG: nucleoside triphosphate pyrophosphohydrolase family protein [Candidatus Thermoplasmatota archaeon]|nr:nucleoside triphosphate pyrophosphohydrolase family protein [Candidatus Thermoplasmatota archaeon]
MARATNVDEWMNHRAQEGLGDTGQPNGSFETMMARVAKFHHKHDFANPENNGHDMGYRLALVIEELGELSAAITKGKPKEEAAEELADIFILTLGNALAMEVDLESEFHKKLDRIMKRPSKRGGMGIRVTEYSGK